MADAKLGMRAADVNDFLHQLRAMDRATVVAIWEDSGPQKYLRRMITAGERIDSARGNNLSASVHSAVVREYRAAMGELGYAKDEFPGRALPVFRNLSEHAVVSIAGMDTMDSDSYDESVAAFVDHGFRIPPHPDAASGRPDGPPAD